ncbi:MAG: hypothetical protein PHP48_05375 [Bacteroidales bacterium]|jgi:hypothetical protein|nr:hypothetical protein [Bacteroidales bacterium]
MVGRRSNKKSLIIVWGLVLLLGLLKFGYQQNNLLSFDYFGLYLHLPATFIYNDPAISDMSWLEKINETYNNTPTFYQLQKEGQYNIIRFFNGIAILLSPFFFLGHLMASMSQYPADGFSYPYQLAMMIAAWFYVIVGLIFTRKVLLKYFDDTTTSWTLIALYLGTNLIFWSTFDAGAPHTILLSFYAMLLWFTIRWHEEQKKRFAIAIGLLLGLIIVSRPSDIVAILIPLLWNVYDSKSLKNKILLIKTHFGQLMLLVFFTFLAGLPQLLYFYAFTGNFIYSTYTDPQSGFDFTNPRFGWVLFSFRKGWLIYAPLMTFALLGFIPLWRKHKALLPPLFLHFLLNLFLIASFTSLISYGWRAFIQSYALLVLPLAAFIALILNQKWPVKTIATAFLAFFIWLSSIQGWQIMMGIIDSSKMTKEYYFKVFGKKEINPDLKKYLRLDHYLDDQTGNKIPDTSMYQSKVLVNYDFQDTRNFVDPKDSTNYVFLVDDKIHFSKDLKIAHQEITDKTHYWARVSLKFKGEEPINKGDALLVCTYTYNGPRRSSRGQTYKYRTFPLETTKDGEWHILSIDYLAPEPTTENDQFQTYIWNRSQKRIYIDNFKVKVFEPKE